MSDQKTQTILTASDQSRINRIFMENTDEHAQFIRIEQGVLRFNTNIGEKATQKACKALMKAGLQHVPGDGKPEFTISGSEGADRVEVKWPLDLEKPLWKK